MTVIPYKRTKPSESSSSGGIITAPDPNEVAVMKLRIIPTLEGYYDALDNLYIYNYLDHLGNVRLSYTDTNKDGVIQPRQYMASQCYGNNNPPFELPIFTDYWKPGEIVEVNNYYPFGLYIIIQRLHRMLISISIKDKSCKRPDGIVLNIEITCRMLVVFQHRSFGRKISI